MSKKLPLFPLIVTAVLLAAFVFVLRRDTIGIFAQENPVIPDNYIVVLKPEIQSPDFAASEIAKEHGLSVNHVYNHAIKGFSAVIPSARLNSVKNDSRVKFVSEDRKVYTSASVSGKGRPTPTQPVQPAQTTPSGLSRIGKSSSNFGSGVGVAVIDTGIDLTHPDLVDNIVDNYTCVRRTKNGDDDNGHGTHVAGTISATENTIGSIGVAPQAGLYAVKVLDSRGSGSWSSVICGIDWVASHASQIKVANMSLGGLGNSDDNCGNSNSDALHQAICSSRNAGITYVVAAGNESDNADNHVPGSYNDAVITVSALVDTDGLPNGLGVGTGAGADDTFASFSNFGSSVDIGAPGVWIYSTWRDGTYNTISGTSMATPHTSGIVALYRQTNPNANLQDVLTYLSVNGEAVGQGHTDPSGNHPERY